MLSWFRRNTIGARLWISDQRPDDYRREITKIYEELERLFELERNMLLAPLLLALIAALVALIAFPPSSAKGGWQGTAGVVAGVSLGVFLVTWFLARLFCRAAHQKVLGNLEQQAAQRRVQEIIRHLAHQDRSIRPLVRKYHLAEERKKEEGRRSFSVRLIPPKPKQLPPKPEQP